MRMTQVANKKFKQNTAQNGIALLLTVIILSIVTLIAVFIVRTVTVQLKLASDISDSQSAIYAADSGIECQLYDIRHGKSINCNTAGGEIVMSNGAMVITTTTGTYPSFTIKALGSLHEVKRQFEVSF